MGINTQILGEPVNSTARRVISKGFEHKWKNDGVHQTWDTPQPTRIPKNKAEDYRGVKFGKMECIGLLRDMPKRWLCRCDCGNYEPRSAKAIRNKNNADDSCVPCRTLHERKRQAVRQNYFDKHGHWPDQGSGVEAKRIVKEWYR